MERKNTMLLTVIAVATLLVAVVGATFAYYSVSGDHVYNSSAINTTTGKIGTVTYTATQNQLYLNVRSAQMANTAQGTYYSTTANEDAGTEAVDHTIGTFALTGAGDGDKYKCTFTWGINVAETSTGKLTNLENNESVINFSTSGGSFSGIESSYYTKAVSTTPINNSSAYVILTANASGNATATITGYQTFVNNNTIQNDLAELGLTTTVQVTSVSCDTFTE